MQLVVECDPVVAIPALDGLHLLPQLAVLTYNLGHFWRRLELPHRNKMWSLTSSRQPLRKTDGRLVKHARYYWLLLAESHLMRRLFASMLGWIKGLPLPSG